MGPRGRTVLEPQNIAFPVRAIIRRRRNVNFQVANVARIDLAQKLIITDRACRQSSP